MFSLLLSSSYMKSRSFSASHAALLVSRLGGARSWKETGQQTQGISHTIRCHAQCINQEESWPRPLHGKWLGIGQQVVDNCIVQHLFCIFLVFYLYCYYYFPCPIKLSLSQPTNFTFFPPVLCATPLWGRVSEQLCGI